VTDAAIQYAGFWRRLGAFALDALLYTAFTTPVLVALYGRDYFTWTAAQDSPFAVYGLADLLLTNLLPLLAVAFCWVRWGATPGKWLLNCQVVDAHTLQPLTWKQAGLRLLGYLVSAMLLYLGFLWIAFDRRKQGLHDKLVGSVVLHRSPDDAGESLEHLMRGWP